MQLGDTDQVILELFADHIGKDCDAVFLAFPVADNDLMLGKFESFDPQPKAFRDAEAGAVKQLGGKLGRHPQLAREMPGIYDPDAVLQIVQACIDLIKAKSTKGERFGQLLKSQDFDRLVARFHAAVS